MVRYGFLFKRKISYIDNKRLMAYLIAVNNVL